MPTTAHGRGHSRNRTTRAVLHLLRGRFTGLTIVLVAVLALDLALVPMDVGSLLFSHVPCSVWWVDVGGRPAAGSGAPGHPRAPRLMPGGAAGYTARGTRGKGWRALLP